MNLKPEKVNRTQQRRQKDVLLNETNLTWENVICVYLCLLNLALISPTIVDLIKT